MAVEPEGSGTATDETDDSPYEEDAEVSIKAEAEEGWAFVNWTAPAGSFDDANDPNTTFTMPGEDVTVTANFELVDYEVNLSVEPDGSGTVTGDDTYNFGESVTIVATPEDGYEFVNWTDDDDGDAEVSTDASYTFDMPANDVNYTANFVQVVGSIEYYTHTSTGGDPDDPVNSITFLVKDTAGNVYDGTVDGAVKLREKDGSKLYDGTDVTGEPTVWDPNIDESGLAKIAYPNLVVGGATPPHTTKVVIIIETDDELVEQTFEVELGRPNNRIIDGGVSEI